MFYFIFIIKENKSYPKIKNNILKFQFKIIKFKNFIILMLKDEKLLLRLRIVAEYKFKKCEIKTWKKIKFIFFPPL